jgi:molybdopterin-guanine dinucleotide biosynthesis protein A
MGTDKALLLVDGVTIIERIVRAVTEITTDIVLITNRPESYAFLNLPVVRDTLPHAGPLSAIYDALRTSKHELVLVIACDFPVITTEALRELLHHECRHATVPLVHGRMQPLCAMYHTDCLDVIHHLLEHGERSVQSLLREIKVEGIVLAPRLEAMLVNVNTMEEYNRLTHH